MRSIPALAGEPGAGVAETTLYRVYPRACGGTSVFSDETLNAGGLSPRLRGNH